MRRECLVTGEVYHVYNKSIADFKIFNNDVEFFRMKETISYYQPETQSASFSGFKRCDAQRFKKEELRVEKLVQIICYCIMPTHIHLVLKQLKDNGISVYVGNILNSYTRYFNVKHKRKGPLWESRFKDVLVESDEQLLHLTRYVHLNPPTARLVNNPIEWPYSSYKEYIAMKESSDVICDYKDILDIKPDSYKIFAEDRVSYQRELAKIKALLLD